MEMNIDIDIDIDQLLKDLDTQIQMHEDLSEPKAKEFYEVTRQELIYHPEQENLEKKIRECEEYFISPLYEEAIKYKIVGGRDFVFRDAQQNPVSGEEISIIDRMIQLRNHLIKNHYTPSQLVRIVKNAHPEFFLNTTSFETKAERRR